MWSYSEREVDTECTDVVIDHLVDTESITDLYQILKRQLYLHTCPRNTSINQARVTASRCDACM